ncbi:protein kinase domain-containing protein [Floridanema evergladense]|uniref:Protein kinase n=1 Tax=Floridaenema evergladense BLCC-F167 TaxID=3153639 RepID=A0ABV4WVH3_9CYAN
MNYCFNPACEQPENPQEAEICLTCHWPLWLRNRYRSLKLIEEGNFGRTLLCIDRDRLNACCVIKQFFKWRKVETDSAAMARATQIFEKEAKLLLQLGEHPQIPTLLACFEHDKRLYLVQEYIEGQNLLDEILEQGVFSEQKIRNLLNDLLPILKFIHQHHIVHRDIKPMNVIRRQSDQKLVLVDFGLAKLLKFDSWGKTGSQYGTEGYAAIEQTRGKVYPASDLFSLGVTCVQLLTGTVVEELYQAEAGVWVWREYLREKGTDISDKLAQILNKLLKDSLKERYQNASEVIQDLQVGAPRWQCIKTFSGHLGIVNRVTFSPDGETVASGSEDKTLKVWQLETGKLIQSVISEPQGVKFAVISPDGKMLASGSGDNLIQIWQLPTEKLQHTLVAHLGIVHQVAFSSNGQTLVSASADSTIKFWDTSSGELLHAVTGHNAAVKTVIVSLDGKFVVSGSEDKTIKIWHLGSGVMLHNLTEHSQTINSLAISPDNQLLASGSADNTIRIWHLATGKLIDILTGHSESVCSVAFSPNGKMLASGSEDRTVKIWGLGAGEWGRGG